MTVLGTLVAIAGTVITTFIALQDRPAPYRLADWAQSANAVCDSGRAAMSGNMGRVNSGVEQALSAEPPDPEAAAQEFESATDYYREFIGPLRNIRLPEEGRGDVEEVFRAVDELDRRYYSVADLTRQMDPNDLMAEPLASGLLAGFQSVDQQHAEIAESFRALGATSCAVVPQ